MSGEKIISTEHSHEQYLAMIPSGIVAELIDYVKQHTDNSEHLRWFQTLCLRLVYDYMVYIPENAWRDAYKASLFNEVPANVITDLYKVRALEHEVYIS